MQMSELVIGVCTCLCSCQERGDRGGLCLLLRLVDRVRVGDDDWWGPRGAAEAVALGLRGLLSVGVVLGAVLGGGALQSKLHSMLTMLTNIISSP